MVLDFGGSCGTSTKSSSRAGNLVKSFVDRCRRILGPMLVHFPARNQDPNKLRITVS